jgi:hypothetical protein
MNDTQIESLLRKAPRPAPLAGLKEELERGIRLPRTSDEPLQEIILEVPFWRRWFPAFAFGLFFLVFLVVLGVQAAQILQLHRENEALRASLANLEPLRERHAELQKLALQNQELERLRGDSQDLDRLRVEVKSLRERRQELSALRADNQRLRGEWQALQSRAPAGAGDEVDPFAEAKAKAMRINCVNCLKQIGLAARIWENQRGGDVLPDNFLTMSNELATPKVLYCPADERHTRATSWAAFGPENLSYEILSPGITIQHPDAVYARCPVHNNVVLVDGSVHQLGDADQIAEVDGVKKISRGTQPRSEAPSAR